MKHIVLGSITALAVVLVSPHAGQAQGTMLYLSSLSQTYTDTKAVGSDSWLAADIRTGNNPGGYTLDSIQLGMADASGNPGGFTVMLYTNDSHNGTGFSPGTSVGTLTGPASPSTAGVYSYAPTASLTLSPSTHYYVVLTAATAVANGAYNWGLSAYPPSTTGGWGGAVSLLRSTDGATGWREPLPYNGDPQLAIWATSIPEPGTLSLVLLGGLVLMRHRKLAGR